LQALLADMSLQYSRNGGIMKSSFQSIAFLLFLNISAAGAQNQPEPPQKEGAKENTSFQQEVSPPDFPCSTISSAAHHTYLDHLKAAFAGEEELLNESEEVIIPEKYWDSGIKQLKPISVYRRDVHVVIVLKMLNNIEEGCYSLVLPDNSNNIALANPDGSYSAGAGFLVIPSRGGGAYFRRDLNIRNSNTARSSITGIVCDSSGSVIQGANVTMGSSVTGELIKAVTNAAGIYCVNGLLGGRYSVSVEAEKYAKRSNRIIYIPPEGQIRVNFEMKPAIESDPVK
jgi:hypothetical protein